MEFHTMQHLHDHQHTIWRYDNCLELNMDITKSIGIDAFLIRQTSKWTSEWEGLGAIAPIIRPYLAPWLQCSFNRTT